MRIAPVIESWLLKIENWLLNCCGGHLESETAGTRSMLLSPPVRCQLRWDFHLCWHIQTWTKSDTFIHPHHKSLQKIVELINLSSLWSMWLFKEKRFLLTQGIGTQGSRFVWPLVMAFLLAASWWLLRQNLCSSWCEWYTSSEEQTFKPQQSWNVCSSVPGWTEVHAWV